MEILIYGIINSITLALMALGFTLVYGISRLPNFAHGALYVITGFFVWGFLNTLGLNYFLAILLALIITGLIGAAMYQFVLIRVRGMATSEIIASYAIALAILEGLRWGGFRGMTYTLPPFVEGSIELGSVVSVDFQRLMVVGIGAVIVAGLWLFTHFNRIGLALRGMAQDERAAMMLGIDSDRMAVVAMALGSVLAGVAAVVLLPLGNIVVEAGYSVLIFAIAVCIVGGLGSWVGAVLAAFIIGFAQILTVAYIESHFQMVVALLAIIITLILKPSGLFGRQKELEERV
jgi:branched-chain amino acid transport system permease protein